VRVHACVEVLISDKFNPMNLDLSVKYASAGGEPAEAFAKGGDSEEHLGGVFVPSPFL
jgi:hypothetical protein